LIRGGVPETQHWNLQLLLEECIIILENHIEEFIIDDWEFKILQLLLKTHRHLLPLLITLLLTHHLTQLGYRISTHTLKISQLHPKVSRRQIILELLNHEVHEILEDEVIDVDPVKFS
jgi:hypothetical protein